MVISLLGLSSRRAVTDDNFCSDSSVFVRDVFDAIHYKSYLPGGPPVPATSLSAFDPPSGPSAQQVQTHGHGGLGVAGLQTGPQSSSRKRSYNDHAEISVNMGQPDGGNGRQYKQPRRGGGRGGRYDDYNNGARDSRHLQQGYPPAFQNMPAIPNAQPGMPAFDPNNPMAAIIAMQQALGLPVPGMPSFPSGTSGSPTVKKQRCRDYDTKGFCARGNNCMYEHGVDSIYVPPVNDNDGKYLGHD